jgi:hypothetical protein
MFLQALKRMPHGMIFLAPLLLALNQLAGASVFSLAYEILRRSLASPRDHDLSPCRAALLAVFSSGRTSLAATCP